MCLTRPGSGVFRLRPEVRQQLVLGNVAAPIHEQIDEEGLGFPSSEVLVDGHPLRHLDPHWLEKINPHEWFGSHWSTSVQPGPDNPAQSSTASPLSRTRPVRDAELVGNEPGS